MKSFCLICGNPIEYTGEFWDHVGPLKPRHISQPRKVDELIIRLKAHEKVLPEVMDFMMKHECNYYSSEATDHKYFDWLKTLLSDIREYKEYLQNEFGIEKGAT